MSNARAPRLRALQEWMSVVVQHPRTADVAIRSAAAAAHFPPTAVEHGRIVKPNDRMTATDRLQVYNGGYLSRLQEVLETDYPALRHLLGDPAFRALVAAFVVGHPSRHPNLNRFGLPLPAFVARRRKLPHRAFAAEVATLERAVSTAFDAPEFRPLDLQELAAVPPSRWATARFTANPSVQVLTFRFPTNGWYQAFLDEQAPSPPAPAATALCVYRKDQKVWRMKLSPGMHSVLAALLAGRPLGEALGTADGEADVMATFQSWAHDGLFAAVRFRR